MVKINNPFNDFSAEDKNVAIQRTLTTPENNSNNSDIVSSPITVENLDEALMKTQGMLERIALIKKRLSNNHYERIVYPMESLDQSEEWQH